MLRKKLKLQKSDNNLQNAEGVESSGEGNANKKGSVDPSTSKMKGKPFWKTFYEIECRLNDKLRGINFVKGQVAAVYNPVEYAAELHCAYLEKYLTGPKSVLFIGMNPGPWGMVQTGVMPPFYCYTIEMMS